MSQASAAADDLRRRQAELEQKEAELARKEQEMQRTMQGQSKHSFYASFYIIPFKNCS
jgi:DNA repair exonuclease SbcCD ATPase subunit